MGGRNDSAARRGFTLLELLVAIAAMGVVTSLGVRAFFGLTDAWRETRRVAELESAVESAFNTMGRDFGSVVSAAFSGEGVTGQRRETEDPRFFQQTLGNDRLSMPVYVGRDGAPPVPMRVAYAVDREEHANSLVRFESPLDGADENEMRSPVLDRGDVLRLRFEYAHPETGEWTDDWTETRLPSAVRVSMAVAYRERIPLPGAPKLQISRKAVFPIRVR